ncbi:protein transport protein sft2 isoform X2 [Nematostella vectensis]|uniref:protein transport protein sft2 isoform X2 n=1 Tax=Nematostella vectensis TaxID=45351 RepID=UPI0020772D42|nr:protein transport protein sft2 isoform X2 [Nematostella vectensis]
MEAKLNALKDFASFGSSKKASNTDYKPVDQTPNSQSSNGQWGAWLSKGEEDPYLPSLSRKQRILGFFMCLLMGVFCFVMAGFIAPFIVLKARKFVMLYTMGSLFTIGSFSLLWGPVNHVKHLCSLGRLPFTAAYFGSMIATLYMALIVLCELYSWRYHWHEVFHKTVFICCDKDCVKHTTCLASSTV